MYRFSRTPPLPYKESLHRINELYKLESDRAFAVEATTTVNQCIAHLDWNELDPITSYQTIPIWENPVLWGLGRFSNLPHYQRYNFTHYKRTLERGFGICGDASMILSQLLEMRHIPHHIVAFNEHVLIEANVDGQYYMLDPDFGVSISDRIDTLSNDKEKLIHAFKQANYTEHDALLIHRIINTRQFRYKNTQKFVPKRYWLERISYWLYWFLPTLCLVAIIINRI